ncbi:pilus assembly protein TadG-related protein [Acidicapsa ligni]|uniref:pilus assembly protein TadG-related protein n=1 Tax=Acidicapsa ligni TaxID=542300 RepID=UPI0021E0F6E4|nr:pilus assembly protein TadG-related protein [Acidicapsa ligni]
MINSNDSRHKKMNILRRLSDERGQTLVVGALCMTVILCSIGFAIDIGHVRYVKRTLQTAADAAAIAAAAEIRVCGTTPDCGAMTTAAEKALGENNYTVTTVALNNCSPAPGSALTLTINSPACSVSTDPNKGLKNYAEAIVSDPVPTYFAKIFGVSTIPVTARAEAGRGLGGPCIYALDPTAPGAITLAVGLGFRSNCGIVDESNSNAAATCLLTLGTVSIPQFYVVGHTGSGLLDGLLCGVAPPARVGMPVPSPADPLAYLPSPTPPTPGQGCGSGAPNFLGGGGTWNGSSSPITILIGGLGTSPFVFNPGIYCGAITEALGLGATLHFYPGTYEGGINIVAGVGTTVIFEPGTYILEQGPGPLGASGGLNITISALSSITGNGVTFYNAGNVTNPGNSIGSISITAPATLGLSSFNLSAPASGEYGGILFFQGHGVNATGTVVASLLQGSSMNGAFYLPNAQFTYAVGAIANNYNIIVADTINFGVAQVLTTVGNNYATLQSGSPLNGNDVTLVQ